MEKVSELIEAVAGARQWSDTRQSWINRAARRAGISYRAAKAIYYGEITDPEHRAVRRLVDAAGTNARREATELADKLDTIARGMRASDPDFHGADISALVYVARKLRNCFGTGDDGST